MSDIKQDMKDFYASEAKDRETAEWLELGGSARIPESRASHYFIDRKVETALAMAPAPTGSRILEVGCSFGHMTFLLTRRFSQVTAVDISPESIDLARRRAARWNVHNVRFEVADAEHLSAFPEGGFDAVFSFSTLRFCPDPAAAMREYHRVVRPGGWVVVDFPNRLCPWYGPIKRRMAIEPHVHDRLFSAGEAETLARDAGFTAVRHRHILFTSKRVPDASVPAFRVLDAVLEHVPGVRRLAGIVMVRGERRAAG
jgi:SAM-dependent methyltransferase